MKILLVEDDPSIRNGISVFLRHKDFEVLTASNGREAFDKIKETDFNAVITDIQMPEINGLELLELIKDNNIKTHVIVITAFATVENAVLAMQKGAEDFLTKPLNLTELQLKLEKLSEKIRLGRENKALKAKLEKFEFKDIIGDSSKIKDLKDMITLVAQDPNVSVFISGESGTGKELVARNIHRLSNRKDYPFIPINCAALPSDLLESELFGYVKGAFTGAVQNKVGLFEAANFGTIFLDEIGEMDATLQAKLLRVLQDHQIKPVGSNDNIQLDIRIISASNKKLTELVERNAFREDLFYRLNVIEIEVPPLRERKEDIPLLLNHFVNEKYSTTNKNIIFDKYSLKNLINYSWPGNVRELQNLISKLSVTIPTGNVTKENLPEEFTLNISSSLNHNFFDLDYQSAVKNKIKNFEFEYLKYHLNKHNNNISKTADSIGLSRVSLHKKIKELKLIEE